VLADGRRGARARHVGAPPHRVDERRAAVARDYRIASHHVAPDAARGRVVVDGQGAEHRDRLGLALAHVRLLADEVLLLDLAPGHAGLDHVVLVVELEPECAAALLQTAALPADANPAR